MEVELSPLQEKQLMDLAEEAGKPARVLAGEILGEALSSRFSHKDGDTASDPAYEQGPGRFRG
jgi:hypothetical protein